MRQFFTIAVNAFMELIRQPIFLLLMTGSVLFEIFLAVPYYFAFGDEPKLALVGKRCLRWETFCLLHWPRAT